MKRARYAVILVAIIALSAVIVTTSRSDGQRDAVEQLSVAIYTPMVQFANSTARLSYVQGLAKSLRASTGIPVRGLSFTSLSKLLRAKPDFAIVDGQCYAANMNWRLLASARIGGRTNRPWALYSRLGPSLSSLRGKKLAFVKTGCDDSDFIDNAMLESEIDDRFFGEQLGKTDLAGALALVATYKGAHAVFAPLGSHKGLPKVFDSGSVPNPAFVQLNSRLANDLVDRVRETVIGYGGSSAIDGWSAGKTQQYRALRRRMAKRVKRGLFAVPEPMRLDANEYLIEPASVGENDLPQIEQNFEKPPERQE
ncbi:MAG: hypothetical protein MJE77_41195 [Proteobacteria bacterium]|nr:hypothetical protein [Pseudomonadota bacterium]